VNRTGAAVMTNEDPMLYMGPTMGDLYARALRSNPPDAVALWDDDEELTYTAFAERVARFASVMRAAGLKRGDALAQLSRNRVDAVCTIAAAFLVGLRYTPLNALATAADQSFILQDAQIDALVVGDNYFADVVPTLRDALPPHARIFSHDDPNLGIALRRGGLPAAADPLACDARPEDIAMIAYTGGTTGRPKGVVHRHRSLVTNVLVAMGEWEWRDPIRFLAVTPISHAAFPLVLPVLLRGGSFGISSGFTPDGFARLVERRAVTATIMVPTMIYLLLDGSDDCTGALKGLDTVIYGSAPISPQRLREAVGRFGPIFAQLYGQTEAPMAVSMLFKRDHDPDRIDRLSSCGVPLCASQVALLDESGHAVPVGEVGELCVRGPLVMEGYWNRPDETAAALQHGWLHTGDMARQGADGFLTLVDRKKDLIISGGFNVYPREVEDVIAGHPAVAQCCVVGAPHPKWGEAVTAVVVLRSGASTTAEEIIACVKAAKGSAMAPKVVEFIATMPLTAVGKVDRKAVRARFWSAEGRQIQ
jgi:fatty-acyl-CoA synthase